VLYHGHTLAELFDGLSLTFPTQSSHRIKSKIVWRGEVIPDDRAKTILLEELKPKSDGPTLLLSEEYFLKGRVKHHHSLSIIIVLTRLYRNT